MSSIPTGTELARPFMPAKDFDLSKRCSRHWIWRKDQRRGFRRAIGLGRSGPRTSRGNAV